MYTSRILVQFTGWMANLLEMGAFSVPMEVTLRHSLLLKRDSNSARLVLKYISGPRGPSPDPSASVLMF